MGVNHTFEKLSVGKFADCVFGIGMQPYLDELVRAIATATHGHGAGMFLDSVQSDGGIIEMPPGFMSGAAKRVRVAGGSSITDEVQSGFDRAGTHRGAHATRKKVCRPMQEPLAKRY